MLDCPHCEATFTKGFNLDRHIDRKHSEMESDTDTDDVPNKGDEELAFYDIMRRAKEVNEELREERQDSLEKIGLDEEVARHMAQEVMLRKDVQKFIELYATTITEWHYLHENDLHSDVMDAMKELMDDDDNLDYEEAAKRAVKKQK